MRSWSRTLVAGLMVATFGLTAAPARADRADRQVRDWYKRYLQREAGAASRTWSDQLRQGADPTDVEAGILASDEYYDRHGGWEPGFVQGLYRDVLGRRASHAEVDLWLNALQNLYGDRHALATQFLYESERELRQRGRR
jgi:hypothetical protein